ncbi:MAG: hypothetical protein JWN69_2590 [Alphaproteobacteria bacterium]|nr:hypothetical protein [Alphaproteobacteria bacterium]
MRLWLRREFAKPWVLWGVAGLLALAILLLHWPGALIGDSVSQLEEIRTGHLRDWNPPLMATIWRALGATPQAMLLVQVPLYWFGLALLAHRLRQESSARWGYAMLVVGLTPMSLIYLGRIQKDTLLVSLLLLVTGLTVQFGRAAGLVPALLGMLTRANAIFAVPPLFLRSRQLPVLLVVSLAVAAALVPVSQFINLSLLGAERSHVEKSLQLFDLAGIEVNSGRRVIGPEVSRCYSPFYWDTLQRDCNALDRTPADLTAAWIAAIGAEPLAYFRHRLTHFNHSIYFLVPPMQDCVYVPSHHACGPGEQNLLKDALVRNALLWPVTWLVVGALLLFMPLTHPARALTLSGMLYGLSYLVVGVASGFRYFYWTELAVQAALVWQLATAGLPRWRLLILAVAATWAAGYAYRYGPLLV